MAKLRVPTVQHLARNWFDSPEKVEKKLVHMALNPPIFNYNALIDAARDLLIFGVPENQIAEGIRTKEKRESVRKILLDVVPLLCKYFKDVQPDFVHEVAHRFYPIGRDLKIPFKPTFIYGLGEQIYFPWFSFWRSNPLNSEQLSLFVTLVDEMLLQDPELESAKFEILDFSAQDTKEHRRLRIINTTEIPRLGIARKQEMLSIFAEGFQKAEVKIQNSNQPRKRKKAEIIVDVNQMSLWD